MTLTIFRQADEDTRTVERLYVLADALKAAETALGHVPYGRRPAFDELADKPVYLGDLDAVAAKIRVMADLWQADLDADLGAAEEADDRRRDNPLERDFRRLG